MIDLSNCLLCGNPVADHLGNWRAAKITVTSGLQGHVCAQNHVAKLFCKLKNGSTHVGCESGGHVKKL